MSLESYLEQRQSLINRALERALPGPGRQPEVIHRAMRYSVLGQGKRIRPILALAACEAAGGRVASALHAACALEMIHAYSLVHDDLPAMDDDDFRRGKPSCHKKFGEAIGVLTGDALLTYAFQMLARPVPRTSNGTTYLEGLRYVVPLEVAREVAEAIGTRGMIGGQVSDVAAGEGHANGKGRRTGRGRPTGRGMEEIHTRKTGALIAASVRVGALLGRARPSLYRALCRYGRKVGLVFQLVDDLLDSDGLVPLWGEARVRGKAARLTESAIRDLRPLGKRAEPLRALARFILTRES